MDIEQSICPNKSIATYKIKHNVLLKKIKLLRSRYTLIENNIETFYLNYENR